MKRLGELALEDKVTKLERILLGKGDSITKDTASFSSNIEDAYDLLKDSLELWYEGLVLSPEAAANARTDLTGIITMCKKIMRDIMYDGF